MIDFSSKGHIMLCGDFNARTGNQSDFISADSDIPIDLPCGYVPDSITCPCISQDSQINAQGRLLLDLLYLLYLIIHAILLGDGVCSIILLCLPMCTVK